LHALEAAHQGASDGEEQGVKMQPAQGQAHWVMAVENGGWYRDTGSAQASPKGLCRRSLQ
jgi:hypothetical protein